MVFHNEDGNPARANIKQALGSNKKIVPVIDHWTTIKNLDSVDHLKMEMEMETPNLIKVSKLPQTLMSCISSQRDEDRDPSLDDCQDYVWAMISRKLKITVKDKRKMNQKITIPNVQDIKCLRAKD
ncbi:hypothetical protein Tco_1365146 [Tanacetum coccineum]